MEIGEIEIKKTSPQRILRDLKSMRKEHVIAPTYPFTGEYLGAYVRGVLVGCVGWFTKGNTVRYRTDYVAPPYRKMGIYTALFTAREEQCARIGTRFTAFCTPRSLAMYESNGFIKKNNNKKIKFVER